MRLSKLIKSPIGSPAAKNGGSRKPMRLRAFLIVLLAIDAVLLFWAFRPPGRSLSQLQDEAKRNRAQYEEALTNVRQMRDLKLKLQSAIDHDRKFSADRFLSRKTAFSAMVTDLEKLATENQLRTQTVGYQLREDKDQPDFQKVAVSISVEGSYADLVRFINRLEKSDLFWIINNLNVSNAAGRGLRLNVQLETYAVPT